MNHTGTIEIQTERLILRRCQASDAEVMFRNWCNDEEVTRYLTWPAHGSLEVSEQVARHWSEQYEDESFYQWMIVPLELNEAIGTISVVGQDETVAAVEMGYCIGRPWWGRGYVSEAFRAVIRHLFEEVGVNRITAKHHADNLASGRVMEACGLRYEGCTRQSNLSNAGLADAKHYAILRSDYEELSDE